MKLFTQIYIRSHLLVLSSPVYLSFFKVYSFADTCQKYWQPISILPGRKIVIRHCNNCNIVISVRYRSSHRHLFLSLFKYLNPRDLSSSLFIGILRLLLGMLIIQSPWVYSSLNPLKCVRMWSLTGGIYWSLSMSVVPYIWEAHYKFPLFLQVKT